MTQQINSTPYPTVGELLNETAELFCSKPIYSDDSSHPDYRLARKLKQLAKDGDFDLEQIEELKARIFTVPFEHEFADLSNDLAGFGSYLVEVYIKAYVTNVTLDGYSRKQTIPWLINHRACKQIHKLIIHRQRQYWGMIFDLDYFSGRSPLGATFTWLKNRFPQYLPTNKAERDQLWKWTENKHIPSNESLWSKSGYLTKQFDRNSASIKNQGIISEVIFFGRMLQIFSNRTRSLQATNNLKDMFNNEYVSRDIYEVLDENLPCAKEKIYEELKDYLSLLITLKSELTGVPKSNNVDKNSIHIRLENAKELQRKFSEYALLWWEIERCYGRWHLFFNKNLEKAIVHYVEASRGVTYSGSMNTKQILRETITLCSVAYEKGMKKIDGKTLGPILKRLKNQATAFGFHFPWLLDEKGFPALEKKICASYRYQYFSGYDF